MDKNDLLKLLEKYEQGNCSPEELTVLDHWYDSQNHEIDCDVSDELPNKMWNSFKSKIFNNQKEITIKKIQWLRYVAAAIIIIVAGGVWFISSRLEKSDVYETVSDIKPGGNRAMLILENGEQINLDQSKNGVLTKTSGIEVLKLADGQLEYKVSEHINNADVKYNTIITPKAGQYKITLPDGTKVWLNAASSLKYPSAFIAATRQVELNGEGYFEVFSDIQKPFIVKTKSQEIKVLGTHFNVNSYHDDQTTKTALLEGKVQVLVAGEKYDLVPGQLAETNGNKKTSVRVENIEHAIAWKNGFFSFQSADIHQVMREISRWYDVDFVYEGTPIDTKITGKIYRNVKLNEVLESISYLGLNFKLNGNKIIVSNLQ